jgi:hypothetical protein
VALCASCVSKIEQSFLFRGAQLCFFLSSNGSALGLERREYTVVYSAVISYPDRDGIWWLTSNQVRFGFGE